MPYERYQQGEFGRVWDSVGNGALEGWAAFFRGIAWLWNATPASWPVGVRLMIYPAVYGVLWYGFGWIGLKFRRRGGDVFGSARFSTLKDLARAGMLRPGGRFLGQFRGKDVYLHGEGHCLTIAAQGGGKTTGLIIPTLINYRTGSVVVTDPKGAITAQTMRLRASFGRVVILNPWRDELKNDASFGVDLGDDGFNPLQLVGPSEDGRAAATLLASLLLPDNPADRDGSYFRQEGRELLEWGMLWQSLTVPAGQNNLPNLHALLYETPDLLAAIEAAATGNQQGPGWRSAKRGAAKFHGMAKMGAGGQLAGIIGTATTALKIYDSEQRLANHVSRDGFKLADLKGKEPLTVYLICPPNHLVGDDRKWLNLTLALIAQEVGKPGLARETVLLMDEFPALGYLPNLAGSLEQFREAGLRAHLIAQNPGQIVNIYGQDGLARFWGACENKQFFRFTDYEQAKKVSDWIGQYTTLTQTQNAKGEVSESLVGVPLIRPEELTGMSPDSQIILRPAMDPLKAKIFPYYQQKEWVQMVDKNPYRGG